MNGYELAKVKQKPVTSIYGANDSVLRKALKNLAEEEYFSGITDKHLWDKAVAIVPGGSDKLPPAVSDDGVLDMAIMNHPMFHAVLDLYCELRGKEILAKAQIYGNAELQKEIVRVKQIQKLYTRNDSPSQTPKYVLVLLIVIFIAVLFSGMATPNF